MSQPDTTHSTTVVGKGDDGAFTAQINVAEGGEVIATCDVDVDSISALIEKLG